jgi:hypothetical protein
VKTSITCKKKSGNGSLQEATEVHTVVRHQQNHIFLDKWLTNGAEVVSLTCQQPFTPRKIPGQRLSQPLGPSVARRIR